MIKKLLITGCVALVAFGACNRYLAPANTEAFHIGGYSITFLYLGLAGLVWWVWKSVK